VAIGTSGRASGAFPELIVNNITSAPMDVWPMNSFPSLVVPAFIIPQLTALLKVRALRREATSGLVGELKTG
jgi:hypothetical protein